MLRKSLLAVLVSGVMISGVQAAGIQPNGYLFGNIGEADYDLGSEYEAFIGSLDDTDTAFKVGAGLQLNPYVGIEFQYVDLGEISYKEPGYEEIAGVTGFGANLVATLPLNRFKLYGKVGYHQLETEWKLKLGGSTFLKGDDDDNVTSFSLGATYAFTPRFELAVEFERYQDVGDKDITGETDVDLASIGLRYNF